MAFAFAPRRAEYINIREEIERSGPPLSPEETAAFEAYDEAYRAMCAVLYNYVPTSGHPGGSISSGRFVAAVLFDAMDYDVSDPNREDADMISYAAGHKALGLYAMWALRNEMVLLAAPELLPGEECDQLRIEDLLGFRRNPTTKAPLYTKFRVKALDGHPTPATPFVRLATGASGVGLASSIGLAFGARDYFGDGAPRVHVVEGEGGMTPGRVGEAMAAAATANLDNAVLHVDWNQASIDSNHVCRVGDVPGDYVQWNPMEFAYLHDWNVIEVPDGTDFQQIIAAQRKAKALDNGQPTAIVYRTTKGWKYGIEGKDSHGAGHKLCVDGFFEAVKPLLERTGGTLPRCEKGGELCDCGARPVVVEGCFWDALMTIRTSLDRNLTAVKLLAERLGRARERLGAAARRPRERAPRVEAVFDAARRAADNRDARPAELALASGTETTLRGELGKALEYYNRLSGGAVLAAAADLLGSTSTRTIGAGFGDGYYRAEANPESRLLSIGGICEDAMAGVLSGIASFGRHLGVGASYGAFNAPLGHISARLHAIGNQARAAVTDEPYRPFVLVCAHAGVKTGEDGPTHADPQALQLLQENFPARTMITLTPWDPQEVWPLLSAALASRPAVIAPFVTRPKEVVLDRAGLGLAPPAEAATGVYRLRAAAGEGDGTLVLQGSEVAYAFVREALPILTREGLDLNVYYVASAELFNRLSEGERNRVFPPERAREAMGITGFTLPTMYRWITSERGRAHTLHPFRRGHFLGSGKAESVVREAGLDGASQAQAIMRYIKSNA